MKKQFTEALKFIKQNGLTQHHLTSFVLKQIFIDLGYQILLFNKLQNTQKVQAIIDAYNLHDNVEHRKIFMFASDNVKLLFIHKYMSETDMIHYLLHELGHIYLGHTNRINDETTQEREADDFAAQVKLMLALQNSFRFLAVTLAAVILIGAAHHFTGNKVVPVSVPQNNIEAVPEPTPLSIHQIDGETVFKTTGGEKIHRADCIYIQNKTNIIELSKTEAIAAGYEPCKVCKP